MKLTQIEYVREVSRCGNMTAAAAQLFVTQPTLSQQIMNLEEELGVKLFIRNPRNVMLTPAGEEFLVYANRILSDVGNLNAAMENHSKLRAGRIRIGMLTTFGCMNIVNKLSIFKKENPEIETVVRVDQSKTLLEMLSSHKLDVAFIIVTNQLPETQGLDLIPLFKNEMMALLPQNHRLKNKDGIDFADLKDENIVMPSRTSSMYEPIYSAFIGAGVNPAIICETSHPELSIQMVSNGMGVAFASERVISYNRHQPFVARRLNNSITQSIYYAVPRDCYVIPVIKRFSDYIVSEYES